MEDGIDHILDSQKLKIKGFVDGREEFGLSSYRDEVLEGRE